MSAIFNRITRKYGISIWWSEVWQIYLKNLKKQKNETINKEPYVLQNWPSKAEVRKRPQKSLKSSLLVSRARLQGMLR